MANGHRSHASYQDLMRYRILDILLVATPYDSFLLEEAGELSERLAGEFRNLDVHYAPGLTVASTGTEAIEIAKRQRSINLILTTPHVADMDAAELARRVRESGIRRDLPVVLLAWDTSDLQPDTSLFERAFLWQGDARILLAIVKSVEDWRNAEHDTGTPEIPGVPVILLIEDDPRRYSSFLPAMYAELLHHSQQVIAEGLNLSQKILRMRARPKILLCTHYEEAQKAFEAYREDLLGIISDVEFPRGGRSSPTAGLDFMRTVREAYPDTPIVLHSSRPEFERQAREVGAGFLRKGSHHVLGELRRILLEDFGFGDFVFRLPDGTEVGRAGDLRSLEEQLASVPAESIRYHGARNHFSRWLRARADFGVAHALRPRKVDDYPTPEALRQDLIHAIGDYRVEQAQSVVADFRRDGFDFSTDFYRIGSGSLGGKARGLAFVRRMLAQSGLRKSFRGVEIFVPPAVVLGTDVFERFLDANDLRRFAIDCEDEQEIWRRFRAAPFPEEAERDLQAFLEKARFPLAVRSSSLLEDSQHLPFTGVYDTLMLRNNAWSVIDRLRQTVLAIKRVYASAFSRAAKSYLAATPYRLEEEKMAVLLQKIVGSPHGRHRERFYPDISGVARSYDFYPRPPMTAGDGITAVCLGMGRGVVEGGACLRFCPRYPQHVPQLSSVEEALEGTQRSFWAIPMMGDQQDELSMREELYGLDVAEADGTLAAVGSTWSPENEAIYDGLSRQGTRLVTFAPVLKQRLFPLADILTTLIEAGTKGMGGPVEIEFAVNLAVRELGVLQMRPLALAREAEAIELGHVGELAPESAVCWSRSVLGHGRIEGIRDLVVVDFQRFERARSRDAATEIARLNRALLSQGAPYLLIGVGRWGSRDPWLGIPVTWDQVAGARVIVEAGLRDVRVEPSQGSHFFQNLTSFHVGYFTVNSGATPDAISGFVDWDWLGAQPALSETAHVRHLRLESPILVKMDGRKGEGVILKPSVSASPL
ncbi:MAG TPA: PEP/pyruvate-binding domain-containing protein [Thermoanaerobaculia bacterium]|nr:PEP/pyruvate-binding domain-containing protein [Thermoanaerobaculia bacterium]